MSLDLATAQQMPALGLPDPEFILSEADRITASDLVPLGPGH